MKTKPSVVPFDPPQRKPRSGGTKNSNRDSLVDWDTDILLYTKLCALLWAGKLAVSEDNLVDHREWSKFMTRAGLLGVIIRHIIPGAVAEWVRKGGNPATFDKNLYNRVYHFLRERVDGKLIPKRSREHPSNPNSFCHPHWEAAQEMFLRAQPIKNAEIIKAFNKNKAK